MAERRASNPATRNALVSVAGNTKVAEEIFLLTFEQPELAAAARPGQFVMISLPTLLDPLLPRPFAIFDVVGPSIQILFRRTGKGTRLVSGLHQGDAIRVLGPLGNGYSLPPPTTFTLAVAGGIGFASLHFLLKALPSDQRKVLVLYGVRTTAELYPLDPLLNPGVKVEVATEDGGRGFKGTVIELLQTRIRQVPASTSLGFAYVCGPPAMLKAAAGLLRECRVPAEFSLESRMACGYGVCQGCVIETHSEGRAGHVYRKVCAEGPVFDPECIVWEKIS